MKENVFGPNAPDVSTATGWKRCEGFKFEYFTFFLVSAPAATAPASLVALARYDDAKVSEQVASQTSSLLLLLLLLNNKSNYIIINDGENGDWCDDDDYNKERNKKWNKEWNKE